MEKLNLETEPTQPYEFDREHERLAKLVGPWRGTAQTIMGPPGTTPIEAAWEGRIAAVLGGRFVRFEYRSSVEGKPIAGEMLIAFESGEKLWRISWVDSFHTGTMILVSVSEGGGTDINVRGSYFAAPGHPHWGWRTVVDDSQADRLEIRMYNIKPDGQEAPGVLISLTRG
ncbi:DUF1579 family protein [Polyangium sp. 6x1]|uniref:DUF1579 family protein n=1 Tax=Polyangium sp. 6x1 TaxID=3042689 RepID=UPI002482D196|nr:DUF1579 family protein [Polyangium sp. 6x1]MDI1445491.1 DUF1579 family protein [Polyangium sp. 6x1]